MAPGDKAMIERTSEWTDEEDSTRTDVLSPLLPAVAVPKRRALLTIVTGPEVGSVHAVRDDQTVVGRGRGAHVRIDATGVSREHARVVRTEDGRYLIEDMRSTNGTLVDGRRIERIERVELQSGARIHIGPTVVVSFSIQDSQAQRITEQIYESSVRDPLTRAYNRRYLIARLSTEMAYARRHSTPLGLVMFDVDHFKRVNDSYGHLAGDEVLRQIASLVQRLVRAEDLFARYGGEEFVVLARGIEQAGVWRLAERLRAAVERLTVAADGGLVEVTISAGVASVQELARPDQSPEGLLRLADDRLYRAKEGGRNRVIARA